MSSPYLDALRMLSRRELSEAQVRQRLARRGHDPLEIDTAIAQLKRERALDDARVAEAIARHEISVKRRGRLRVRREIERAGISGTIARQVVDTTFETLDPDALIEESLARRMRGRDSIEDDADMRRLYRFLIGQGFEADRVTRALRMRRKRS
jgi:regulatory protein